MVLVMLEKFDMLGEWRFTHLDFDLIVSFPTRKSKILLNYIVYTEICFK